MPSGPFKTNAYVIACKKTAQAAIIDPAPESMTAILSLLQERKWVPQCILLTHSHWDHIADVSMLKKQLQIPIFVHPLDAGNLQKPGSDGIPCWISFPGMQPDGFLEEDGTVDIGSYRFTVIHTPGHTPGGICLYCSEAAILISGDTLFKGTIGNLNFSTGEPEKMWSSLDKLAKLPPKTVVYPGHGPKTTIEAEHWLSRAKEFFQ